MDTRKHLKIKIKARTTNTFTTNSKPVSYETIKRRYLISLQKGINKPLKEHLLQVNQASFQSQKTMYWF